MDSTEYRLITFYTILCLLYLGLLLLYGGSDRIALSPTIRGNWYTPRTETGKGTHPLPLSRTGYNGTGGHRGTRQ